MQHNKFILLILITYVIANVSFWAKPLKSQVRVYIIKTLETTLSQIEKEATTQISEDKKELVKNSTLKMQNYIEDVVLAYGKEITIYPNEILEIIISMANAGKTRNEISTKLREYMESKI